MSIASNIMTFSLWTFLISWAMKKILDSRQISQGFQAMSMLIVSSFSIKKLYVKTQGNHNPLRWKRVICKNNASTKGLLLLV